MAFMINLGNGSRQSRARKCSSLFKNQRWFRNQVLNGQKQVKRVIFIQNEKFYSFYKSNNEIFWHVAFEYFLWRYDVSFYLFVKDCFPFLKFEIEIPIPFPVLEAKAKYHFMRRPRLYFPGAMGLSHIRCYLFSKWNLLVLFNSLIKSYYLHCNIISNVESEVQFPWHST